ncbi:MAG: sulfatase [Verrucomicrobiota bacterium]
MKSLVGTLVLLLSSSQVFSAKEEQELPPNILMIISDDLSARALGCYGNEVCLTPHIDRLAQEGVRFTRAYCQYPVCGASRASLMSGLYPETNGVLGNRKEVGSYRTVRPELANHPSMGGFLRRHGFVSIRVSKIYHMGVPGGIEAGEPGGDDPDSWDRAYDVMAPETSSWGDLVRLSPKREHFGSNFAKIVVPNDREQTQADVLTARQAIAILENRMRHRNSKSFLQPHRPLFLAVGFVRPHVPLVAPKRLFDLYPADDMILPEVPLGDLDDVPASAKKQQNEAKYGMSDAQAREALAAYYASTTFMDEQVGELLDSLDALGIREETLVVFLSDHGWNLGEHDCWQKLSLWDDSLRVPLVVSGPGFRTGETCDSLVELVDLYPTLAEVVGKMEHAPRNLEGKSLVPLLQSAEAETVWPREEVYSVSYGGNARAIRGERWKYHTWPDGEEELYDLASDPGEITNLANHPEAKSILEKHRNRMATR